MKIICRSMDITDDDIKKILKSGYNDLTSLILRLSKNGAMDFYCIRNILEYLDAEYMVSISEISDVLNGSDFVHD